MADESLVIEWLAGDGSDRCYYRLRSKNGKDSYVLMQLSGADAEALKSNGYDWTRMAESMQRHGIPVPSVIRPMPEQAAIIIEDYGDITVETEAMRLVQTGDWKGVRALYSRLIDLVTSMLKVKSDSNEVWTKRAFDTEKLTWELDFFLRQYATPIAALGLSAQESQAFENDSRAIAQYLSQHSRYLTHRDFHSRNVMFKLGDLAVIDFQDSRLGPPSYDLVSLIFDSYVPFELTFRVELMAMAVDQVRKACGDSVAEAVEATWRPMLLQRQLKAIGSFGYLTRVKGRGNYLRYVKDALATMPVSIVHDSRWPFLSNDLIKMLNLAAG